MSKLYTFARIHKRHDGCIYHLGSWTHECGTEQVKVGGVSKPLKEVTFVREPGLLVKASVVYLDIQVGRDVLIIILTKYWNLWLSKYVCLTIREKIIKPLITSLTGLTLKRQWLAWHLETIWCRYQCFITIIQYPRPTYQPIGCLSTFADNRQWKYTRPLNSGSSTTDWGSAL